MTASDHLSPEQFTLKHAEHYPYGEGNVPKTWEHQITAHDDSGQMVGRLRWNMATGETRGIVVDPEYRRQGIATAMWHEAAGYDPPPKHSPSRTDEGEAWARSVGARPRTRRAPSERAPRLDY